MKNGQRGISSVIAMVRMLLVEARSNRPNHLVPTDRTLGTIAGEEGSDRPMREPLPGEGWFSLSSLPRGERIENPNPSFSPPGLAGSLYLGLRPDRQSNISRYP